MNKVLVTLAALALSTSAIAGPSWTYVDAGLTFADYDSDVDEDTVGYGLRGSFGFGELWHVQAGVGSVEVGGGKSKTGGADVTVYNLRGGIHPAVTDNTDFVLDIGYTGGEAKFESGSEKLKPSVYDIRTGLRANVGKLELRSFVSINTVDADEKTCGSNADQDCKGRVIGYAVGGQYNFSDAWSVGLDHAVAQEGATDVYVRWSF